MVIQKKKIVKYRSKCITMVCFSYEQVEKRAEEISKLLDLVEVLNKEPETIENLYPSNFDLTSLKVLFSLSH